MKRDIFDFYNMDDNLGGLYTYRQYKIKGWSNSVPNIEKYIQKEFTNGQTQRIIIEIGVQGGCSLLKTFDLIEGKNVKLYGIDIWENFIDNGSNGIPSTFFTEDSISKVIILMKECRLNLRNIISAYNSSGQVELIHGSSRSYNIISRFEDNSVDLLYIDGDHGFQGCYLDLINWYPKVKYGGCIINDDYGSGTVKRAVDQFCEDIGEIYLISDGWQSYFIKK